ncbi:MAG: cupin domain-containing protein [Ignavibacteriae bacterium]|nr:MAG: cupin domain-containing protein [Ignavibacteriota bacterium]
MVSRQSDKNFHPIIDGIHLKTLVLGEATLMTEVHLSKKSILPRHHHPYEQTGYLLSGKLLLQIGEEKFEMTRGDSWCIPKDMPHQAVTLEDSIALEIFSPPREDYKKYLDREAAGVE